MDDTYLFSMREHLAELHSELQGLTAIIQQRELSRYEYRAAERTLQVLIEACIGIAKHWTYALFKTTPADGLLALEQHGLTLKDPLCGRRVGAWPKQATDFRFPLAYPAVRL